jgi:hypothetical protein
VVKPRRLRWTGHVACMRDTRNATKFYFESLKGMEDLGIDGRII